MRVRPRVLVDVSKRTTKTNVLGLSLSMPVGIAPTAMHRMAHCDGEKATARGLNIVLHLNLIHEKII